MNLLKLEPTERLMLQIVLGRLVLAIIDHEDRFTRVTLTELYSSISRNTREYIFGVEKFCEEINARIDCIESGDVSGQFWAYDQVDETEWKIVPTTPGYFRHKSHCITFMAPSREEAEIVVKEKIIPFLTTS